MGWKSELEGYDDSVPEVTRIEDLIQSREIEIEELKARLKELKEAQ